MFKSNDLVALNKSKTPENSSSTCLPWKLLEGETLIDSNLCKNLNLTENYLTEISELIDIRNNLRQHKKYSEL